MTDPIFHHKHVDEYFLYELKISKVKKNIFYPEGIKYSLVMIELSTNNRIICFDNHEKKGHHYHIKSKEFKYNFIDEWKLIEDFNEECEKMKRKFRK